jgi:hypothetical protein
VGRWLLRQAGLAIQTWLYDGALDYLLDPDKVTARIQDIVATIEHVSAKLF